MTPEDLQKMWREQQKKLESAELLNLKVIGELTREKARALAPFPAVIMSVFALIFAFGVYYCIKVDPMYYPVPLICIVGAAMQWFKMKMRRNLSEMDSSVIDWELKLLRCKRNFRILWIMSWILMIPYLFWFNWWMEDMVSPDGRFIIMAVTIVGSLVAFAIHVVRVSRALREIDRCTAYLKEYQAN